MKNFLIDIWARADSLGTFIYNSERRIIAIEFDSVGIAEQFIETAGDDKVWFNPITCPKHLLRTTVLLLWEN